MLQNREINCSIHGLNFNIHNRKHIARAAQEGVVFSFKYGIEVMNETGVDVSIIRAGNANMFLSPVFREALSSVTGAVIELYDTNGAVGAAKGAGIGAGIYRSPQEAFGSLKKLDVIEPDTSKADRYREVYEIWKQKLDCDLAGLYGV
jgi:xylulokinase